MDELQKSINRMLGVTDETWGKYNSEESERENRIQAISLKVDALEKSVNKMTIESIPKIDEIQKSINAMMGIADEVWQKYSPKN